MEQDETGVRPADATDGSQLRVGISLEQKVNLGNYESASIFASLTQIAPDTTAEEIERAMATGRIAFDKLRLQMKEDAAELRRKAGWG